MPEGTNHVGRATSRIDGILKVTGRARYAAEYPADDLLHGCLVLSPVATGRIVSIDTTKAQAIPGVVKIFTHENRPGAAWFDTKWRDQVAPPGHPFRPLQSDRILYADQPVAVVIAETLEAARDAAALVQVACEAASHLTDFRQGVAKAYRPPKARSGIPRPPKPRGNAAAAFKAAPVKVEAQYVLAPEIHNPMEMFATTCLRDADGALTVYDKTQGSQNVQSWLVKVFGLKKKAVRVVNAYVGGAFGVGLRPHAHAFCAVMASLALERSVRITLSRHEMFSLGYRPDTQHDLALACDGEGRLKSVTHEAVAATSRFEDYQESLVNWSGLLYHCDNVRLGYKLAKLDTCTPCDMRAPGAASGVNVFECAIDELAHAAGIDPLAFRQLNYADKDENEDKAFTSKSLEACYRAGADSFGWGGRSAAPRSMQDGNELVGWGMASGVWEASVAKTAATARLTTDGRLTVSVATSDIGTGTYTILTQIGADSFGLPLGSVTARIGDSSLPASPVEGGSWTAASAGSAVQAACAAVQKTVFGMATEDDELASGRCIAGRRVLHRRSHCLEVRSGPQRQPRGGDAGGRGRGDRGKGRGRPRHGADAEVRQLHPFGRLRRGAGRRGARRGAGDAHCLRRCRRPHPQSQDGAQPDPRRRGDGHRHGAPRRGDDRSSVRPDREPQFGRVPCAGACRQCRHRGDLRRGA